MDTETSRVSRPLAEVDHGCLLIADLSGYTDYLLASELDHAHDVLADVTDTVVRSLRPVLRLTKLEGDAAFAYVLAGSYSASTLLDAIDRAYASFRSRVRDIGHATTCTCQACERIPTLDLKFFVHDGSFIRRRVGRNEELVGRDVILVHRLVKNSAAQALGTRGYALLTDACVQALRLDPQALGLREHVEHYEDVGEVRCWLENLDERWRREQERRRVYVAPGATSFELSLTVPVEREIAWDWVTSPARRALWQADRVEQTTPGGRSRPGVTNHCIHGGGVTVEEVVDWRPFDYFTVRYQFPDVGPMVWTTELETVGEETRISVRGERLSGRALAGWEGMRPAFTPALEGMFARLEEQLRVAPIVADPVAAAPESADA